MLNPSRVVKRSSKQSCDQDTFNDAFYVASADFGSSLDANNSTVDDKLKDLTENDSYPKNLSSHSPSIKRGTSPSLIIAAGTITGSTANTSIVSLKSTILESDLDSDASSESPSDETLINMDICAEPALDKRLSTEKVDESGYLEHPPALQKSTLAQKSKRAMTTDELARVLRSALPNESNFLEESLTEWNNTGMVFRNIPVQSSPVSEAMESVPSTSQDILPEFNSGMYLYQKIKRICERNKDLQGKSSSGFLSGSNLFSEDFFKSARARSADGRKKTFFSPLPYEFREKNSSFQETRAKGAASLTKNKVQFFSEDTETSSKGSCLQPNKNIDTRSILAVGQLRKLYSPGRRVQGLQERSRNIPRIEIQKATPKNTVNRSSDCIHKEIFEKIRSISGLRK